MELNNLIAQLLDSKIIENQELGVTLLSSPDVSKEEKRKYIDQFIQDYTEGKVNFFTEENKHIFKEWVKMYSEVIKDEVKKRVKRIE